MNQIKLSTNGQFTLNKPLLDHIGAKLGGHIIINKQSDGTLNIRSKHHFTALKTIQGCIETDLRYSDDDIQKAIMHGYIKSATDSENQT